MFAYEILTEKEATEERFNLLKEGEYDAVISASVDKTSAASGNPMMDMTLQVFDENGRGRDVRDFLVFTKRMMWKVISFASSASLLPEYEQGKLCSEVAIGQRVRVKIGIESGAEIPFDKLKGKPVGSKYPDKNKIESYIKRVDKGITELPNDKELDDDVPFS